MGLVWEHVGGCVRMHVCTHVQPGHIYGNSCSLNNGADRTARLSPVGRKTCRALNGDFRPTGPMFWDPDDQSTAPPHCRPMFTSPQVNHEGWEMFLKVR